MQYSHTIVAIIIGFIFPMYAMITGKKTRDLLIQNQNKLDLVFQSTSLILLSLCGLVLMSLFINNTNLGLVGLTFIFNPLYILAMVSVCLLGYWLISKIVIPDNKIDKLKNSYKDVMYLFPENKQQYNMTVVLSVIAGVCEEIMFRGFLYWQLQHYMPEYFAFILANVIFALGHAGTKLKNALSTFVLGLIFSTAYVLTDSLWLPIVLHILVDFYAMTVGYNLKLKLKTLAI